MTYLRLVEALALSRPSDSLTLRLMAYGTYRVLNVMKSIACITKYLCSLRRLIMPGHIKKTSGPDPVSS